MIYRYSWSKGNLFYRAEWYEPSDVDLTGLTIQEIQSDAVEFFKEWGFEYDPYPIGLPSLVRGTVTFKPSRMPTELREWVKTAEFTTDTNLGFGNEITHSWGCVMRIQLATTDSIAAATLPDDGYMTIWRGVRDVDSEVHPQAGDVMDVAFIDMFTACAKSIPMDKVRDADFEYFVANFNTKVLAREGVVDRLWRGEYQGADRWCYIAHLTSGDTGQNQAGSCLWGVKAQDLFLLWSFYIQDVMEVVARETILFSSGWFDFWLGTFYEQNYGTDNSKGNFLNANQIYFTPFVTDDDFSTANLTYSLHDELLRNFPSLFDVITDLCDQTLCTFGMQYMHIECNLIPYMPLDPLAGFREPTVCSNIDPIQYALRLRNATASTEFAQESDYDERKYSDGGRNDVEAVIPIIFNNAPVATEVTLAKERFKGDERYVKKVSANVGDNMGKYIPTFCYSFNFSLFGIYYADNPNISGDAFAKDELIRVSGYSTAYGFGPDDTSPITLPDPDNEEIEKVALSLALGEQEKWGALTITAFAFFALFKRRFSSTLALDCEIEEYMFDSVAVGPMLLIFWPNLSGLLFDLSTTEEFSYCGDMPTEWFITKVNAELHTDGGQMQIDSWGHNGTG